ncbi:MAG: sporulation integral membrane protein YtvI [Desulfotomaculaceae bacterium]|nr:sporulation integral membrane protein YtvI [Desulfotomaculaceae bacterium]
MPRPLLLIIYTAVAILAVMVAFKYILPILVPFIIAFIFTILMEPLIKVLQRRVKMPRGFAAMTAMVVFFGGIAVLFSAIILRLIEELIRLSASLPGLENEIAFYYNNLVERATAFYVTLPQWAITSLEKNITGLTSNLQGMISKTANSLMYFVSVVPGAITIFVVTLLATYFLAKDRHLIANLMIRFMPAPWGEKTVLVARDVTAAFIAYLKAQSILIFITTIISVIGLSLIGAEYALSMGLLIGFFDLIPVLGPATIYIPWLVWSFATGASSFGIKLTVLYILVIVTRQLLETRIISSNLGLHPLATLVAMYAGLKTLGLAGLVLGPILLIAIQALIKAGVLTPIAK